MKTTKTHCERRRTVEQAINEKMRVLKEFYIVDRVAKKLITEKLI